MNEFYLGSEPGDAPLASVEKVIMIGGDAMTDAEASDIRDALFALNPPPWVDVKFEGVVHICGHHRVPMEEVSALARWIDEALEELRAES